MDWTNWITLGAGLGIGAIGGWLAAQQNIHKISSSNPKRPDVIPPASSWENPGLNPTNTSSSQVVQTSEAPETQTLKEELYRTRLAYQMARELGQFQAGFLARTSHELRSPINSVISLHQLILSDLCEDAAEEREFVAQANTAAQKMLCLLDQLIQVAKASYGSGQFNLRALCLLDVLLEVHQFTYLQAQNRNLRLNIEFPDEAVTVLADPDWLRQILVSLIDTSISLMQEGTIRLTTGIDSTSGLVQIWLEDERSPDSWQEPINLLHSNGSSDTEQTNPLTPTQTAEQIKTELNQIPSPGLVLLVSQKLLEQMGGRLDLQRTSLAPEPTSDNTSDATAEQIQIRIQCSLPIADSVT